MCLGREGGKRPLFLQDESVQEAQMYSETRKGLDARFTSDQEKVILLLCINAAGGTLTRAG